MKCPLCPGQDVKRPFLVNNTLLVVTKWVFRPFLANFSKSVHSILLIFAIGTNFLVFLKMAKNDLIAMKCPHCNEMSSLSWAERKKALCVKQKSNLSIRSLNFCSSCWFEAMWSCDLYRAYLYQTMINQPNKQHGSFCT